MAILDVQPHLVTKASNYMLQKNEDITRQVNNLMNELEGVDWKGAAAVAFRNARTEWQLVSKDNNDKLAAISSTLGASAGKLRETDESHVSDLNRFTSQINI